MGMLYNLGNYINLSTLSSVSSEETIYPKENMYNKRQSLPWRMEAKSGHAIFNFGSNRPIFFAIMNHNLVGTGAFSLTLKTAGNEGALVASPAEAVTWHKQNIWHAIDLTPDQWWRIDVADPDNTANLEFGEIIFYIAGTFTMNYWWPYKEGLEYVTEENITQYGHRHIAKKAVRKTFGLDFEGVTDANLVSEVQAFFEGFDGKNPFVFIPDSEEADSWYVYCLNSLKASRAFLDNNKFSMVLEEQSRGITLL